MTSYDEIIQLLSGVEDFELNLGDATVVVRRDSPESWIVYLEMEYIGRFARHEEDRAIFFKSEAAGDPTVTEWVSDNPLTVISRLVDVRD